MGRFALGVVAALAGAASWGFSASCMQYLFTNCSAPLMFVAAFRMLLAGTLFTVGLLALRREALLALLHDAPSMRRVVVFGLIGLFVCQVTYMIAIEYTNAGTATVLQASNVVIVLFISCWSARRAPRALECLAVGLALFATVLIATKGDFGTLHVPAPGLFWGLASAVAVAFYVYYPKPLFDRWTSPPVTALGMLVGGGAGLVCLLAEELLGLGGGGAAFSWLANIDATGWLVMLLIAVVGTLGAFGLFLYGVSIVGSVKGSLLGTVEPASAAIIAATWLGTAFTWADWVGLALMIATVLIVSLQGAREQQAAPAGRGA